MKSSVSALFFLQIFLDDDEERNGGGSSEEEFSPMLPKGMSPCLSLLGEVSHHVLFQLVKKAVGYGVGHLFTNIFKVKIPFHIS